MSKIKIALGQMHVEKDKYKNLETANTFIKKVAQEGCDLAILPEKFTTPYKTDNFPIYAEFVGEIHLSQFRIWQRKIVYT